MLIPAHVVPLWESIQQEVIGLHAYWINYRQLFGKTKERYDLLGEVAWAFFYIVDNTLLNDVQIGLSRLGDPASSGKWENATLERLLHELVPVAPPSLTSNLERILATYQDRCKHIRYRRDKELAHSDLGALLLSHGHAEGPAIPGPSRHDIEQALEALRDFMNAIDMHFRNTEVAYERFISRSNADEMVFVLKQGLRYKQLQKEGTIGWDDMRQFDRFKA